VNRAAGTPVRASFATSGRPPRPRSRGTRRPGPVTVLTVPAAAMRTALALAGGDAARLAVQADGSVIVANRPRR
jgi:hypothetical protein